MQTDKDYVSFAIDKTLDIIPDFVSLSLSFYWNDKMIF